MRQHLKLQRPDEVIHLELADCARFLHDVADGVPHQIAECEYVAVWVRRRLGAWKDPTSPYDAAVRELCRAALAEYESVFMAKR